MVSTIHQVEIDADADRAFELCRAVERWPDIFPPCKRAVVLEQHGASQLIELTADANGQVLTWQSIRHLYPSIRTVTFRQVRPSPLLRSMEGAWRFYPLRRGALIVLEHSYELVAEVPKGAVSGVSTTEEAARFMAKTVEDNSVRELAGIRAYLESEAEGGRHWRRTFESRRSFPADPAVAFELLHRAEGWPQLLSHCRSVAIAYDDGSNQEFTMSVEVNGAIEEIRTIRACAKPSTISYFQPAPPSPLSKHTGEWLVLPTHDGTTLVSRHTVELDPSRVRDHWGDIDEQAALDRVEQAIGRNSAATMSAVETKAVNCRHEVTTSARMQ